MVFVPISVPAMEEDRVIVVAKDLMKKKAYVSARYVLTSRNGLTGLNAQKNAVVE